MLKDFRLNLTNRYNRYFTVKVSTLDVKVELGCDSVTRISNNLVILLAGFLDEE